MLATTKFPIMFTEDLHSEGTSRVNSQLKLKGKSHKEKDRPSKHLLINPLSEWRSATTLASHFCLYLGDFTAILSGS